LVERHGRRGRAQQQSQNECLHGRTKLKKHTTRTLRPLFLHRDVVRCGAARRIGGVLGGIDPLHWFVCMKNLSGSLSSTRLVAGVDPNELTANCGGTNYSLNTLQPTNQRYSMLIELNYPEFADW
jgi:hypothetical protein